MTSRPRGKRTTSDSSSDSASSAAKGGKKKTSTRRRSAGGAAEKRPPRVSLPPAMGAGSSASKKKAPAPAAATRRPSTPEPKAKAPATKPARSRAAAPAPTTSKPTSARPASKPAPRTSAPARSAQTQPPAAARPAPAAASQPPRSPAAPRSQGPNAPTSNQRPPAQPQQQRPAQPPQRSAPHQNQPPAQPQRGQPSPHAHDQRPQGQRPPQSQQQRPGNQNSRPPAPSTQHQQRPPQQQPQQRAPQHGGQNRNEHGHQSQRPPAPPQSHGRPDQRHQPGRAPNQQTGPGQQGGHSNTHSNNRPAQAPPQRAPQHQQHAPRPEHTAPRPQAPAPDAAPAPAAPQAPKHQIGNATPEGFNQKAFEEIFEKDIPFAQLGLNEWLLKGITEAGFVYPTSIQAKLIPTILAGKDVLGQAKTGTGKTASFALPMLNAIGKGDSFGGLVLVPTRELALQVAADFKELGKYTGLNVLPVYGGQNINTQAQALARGGGPEIIVATPGRVMDMAQRGYLHHNNVKMVVLDEVDRMLDIGFRDDIKRILSSCPKDRQTVFVSATMQPEIEQLARTFARDCEKIIASAGALTVAMVKQFYLSVEPWDKKQLLLHLLTHESPALTVVFCRTKRTVDNLSEYLSRKGIEAHAIHGDMQQGRRNRVIEQLRSGKLSVLIASDLASRGLDVEGITHVINYDLPEDPDLYVHRIGRTARAGRDGVAWALVTPEQGDLLTQIEHLINAEIPKLDYPDFKPGPLPADVLAEREGAARRAEQSKSFNRFAQSFIAPAAGAPAASAEPGGASAPASRPAPAALPGPSPTDASKFPGGIVPSKMPPRLMYGKVKTARSMKQAIAQAQSAAPKPAEQSGPNADT